VEEGKKILMNSGFNFIVSDTMKDAADRVVAAARGVQQ
jgi:succinyl-CoA synthetase beta subunit